MSVCGNLPDPLDRWVLSKIIHYMNPIAQLRGRRVCRQWSRDLETTRIESDTGEMIGLQSAKEIIFDLACYHGDLICAKHTFGRDVYRALLNACHNGHHQIVDLILTRAIVNIRKRHLKECFEESCYQGRLTVVDLFIEKFRGKCVSYARNGLFCACIQGHRMIVKRLIEAGVNNWDAGLSGVCRGTGDVELANLMITKGAKDLGRGLRDACRVGHIHLVNLLIEKGACDWDNGFWMACAYGNLEIAKIMLGKGAKNYEQGLILARLRKRDAVVEFLESQKESNLM
jgi:hypothetical protein